jgi:DNA-binding transcriptional MerR regulator
MLTEKQPLVPVQFEEHPFSRSRNRSSSDHVILLTAGFTMADYCQALFKKILNIGLSDLPAFLEYQCKQVKEPEKWLNTLEKLVKDNARSFNNEDLRHRRSKLISEFGFQRKDIKSILVKKRTEDMKETVSGFSVGKEYNFTEVHAFSDSLKTFEERITYLHGQIYDYLQDQNKFINPVPKPFDALCLSEIERLSKIEEIRHKEALKRNLENGNSQPVVKMRITGKLNYFIDIFYRLMREVIVEGKPYLLATDKQVAEHISNNYLDRNGKDISVKYVLTILEKNRPEKRPKRDKRFDLGDF